MHKNLTEEQQDTKLKQIRYKSFPKNVLMILNLCLGAFYFGYGISYFGTFDFDNIVIIFDVSMSKDLANGLIQGCIPVGAGTGALLSSLLLKKLSRKQCVLAINGVAFVIGIALLIPNQVLLFLGRFTQGLCVGLYSSIIPLMIKQFAPNEISGSLGALNQLCVALGTFFSPLLQYILMRISDQKQHWRIIFGFPLLTILIQTILLLFVYKYQTPRYLIQKKQTQKCREVLEYIYKQNYVDEVLAEKQQQVDPHKSSVISTDGDYQEKQESQPTNKINKIRVFIAIHLAMLQQFVGINAVIAYGPAIAQKVLPDLSNLIPVFLNFQLVIAALATSFLLGKLGRKIIFQFGTLFSIISLVIIAIGFFIKDSTSAGNGLIIAGLFIFMANFGVSLGPVVWLYIPEVIEPKIIPFSTMANWASCTFIVFLFPILQSAIGNPASLFLFFGFYSLVSLFINQKYIIQTKGKLQYQIYQQYQHI